MSVFPKIDPAEIQRLVTEALKGLLPAGVPTVACSTVEAPSKGWCKAEYYDALTGVKFSFYNVPTVVAVALAREGSSRLVTAPTIKIPTVEMPSLPSISVPGIKLPEAPTISVPSITLPPPAEITVPTFEIPYAPGVGGRFVCGVLMQWICDTINPMLDNIDIAIGRVNEAIYAVNSAFAETRKSLIATLGEISDFRDNAQVALDDYSGKIKGSVDAGLADLKGKTETVLATFKKNIESSVSAAMKDYQTKVQAAFDSYRTNIQLSVNTGLSQFIPRFYDMMGLPPPEVSEEERKALMEMGDVNGDGIINKTDLDLITGAFGMSKGDPGYVEAYDLNKDGIIEMADLGIASSNYGKSIVPNAQLLSPAQIRNVTNESFEFYGLSTGMKLCYVAVGRKG